MSYPTFPPSGYAAPALLPDAVVITTSEPSQVLFFNQLQTNIFGITSNTALTAVAVSNVASQLTTSQTSIDSLKTSFSTYSATVSSITKQNDLIISRLDNMQPEVITQSMSFMLGAFVAIAFVLSSKIRY